MESSILKNKVTTDGIRGDSDNIMENCSLHDSVLVSDKGSRFSSESDNESVTNKQNSNKTNVDSISKMQCPQDNMSEKRNLRDRTNRHRFPLKIRQKRQTMQSKTRPLKKWLCDHRGNPYPTRMDKEILVRDSNMSLVQVSNWFANARRRLKCTVKGDLPWSSRVKMYNSNVTGNAELLSVSSDDSLESDIEEEVHQQVAPCPMSMTSQPMEEETDVVPSRSQTPTHQTDDHVIFPPLKSPHEFGSQHKYKHSMLQRYLSDSGQRIETLDVTTTAFNKTRSRRPSGSVGSRDYEEMSTSSGISYTNDSYNYFSVFDDCPDDLEAAARRRRISGDVRTHEDIRWKEMELSAAMALASLARSRKNHMM